MAQTHRINDLEAKALWLRRQVWDMVIAAKNGHIPSCYSCTEIVTALYYGGVVRYTPGVTGFVGTTTHAVPLSVEEEARMLGTLGITGSRETPKVHITFNVGDNVQVTSGPFADFNGVVAESNPERGTVKVLVSIFGRETPVELDYSQVLRA